MYAVCIYVHVPLKTMVNYRSIDSEKEKGKTSRNRNIEILVHRFLPCVFYSIGMVKIRCHHAQKREKRGDGEIRVWNVLPKGLCSCILKERDSQNYRKQIDLDEPLWVKSSIGNYSRFVFNVIWNWNKAVTADFEV